MYLDKAKERFQALLARRGGFNNVRPCTNDEVQSLERSLGIKLPKAYQEFLLWMGRGGGFLGGEEFDWMRVRDDNRRKAIEIMEFCNYPNPLSDDAIIFLVYQGIDAFAFIRASEGDNPPVHLFGEGESHDQITWNFSKDLEEFCLKRIDYLLS